MDPCVAYEWQELEYPVGEDIEQINSAFDEYKSVSKSRSIGDIGRRNIEKINDKIKNSGNNVGIIEFGNGIRIEFRPKLDSPSKREFKDFWGFLPRMLHSLCRTNEFTNRIFIDPFQKIELPEGCNMVPLFALSFVSLCSDVVRKGMLKKYVRRQQALKTIKGKIDFGTLIRTKPWDDSVVPCIYHDLTFNNKENQIVLWCLNKLIKEASKIELGQDGNEPRILCLMRELFAMISQEVILTPQKRSDILAIQKSSLPAHYVELMKLCEVILSDQFFSFDPNQKCLNGLNFIIDMDWVFEQYMTYLFDVVAAESGLKIEPQYRHSLCDKNKIKIRPDVVIFDPGHAKPLAVIDFKWKDAPNTDNANYYQIICYGLAEIQKFDLINIDASIFYASGQEVMNYDAISKIFDGNKNVTINKICLEREIFDKSINIDIEAAIKGKIRNYFTLLAGKVICN